MPPFEFEPSRDESDAGRRLECVAVAHAPLACVPDALALVRALRGDGHAWLLESALQDGRLGRHTLAGADPYALLIARGESLALEVRRAVRPGWTPGQHTALGDPFEAVRALWPRLDAEAGPPEDEAPFLGGAIAVLGYELAERIERVGLEHQAADLDTPDLALLLVDRLVSIDHERGDARAIALGFGASPDEAARAARNALREWKAALEVALDGWDAPPPPPRTTTRSPATPMQGGGDRDEGPGRVEYARRVRRILDDIERGDVYEVNLTQRMSSGWRGDPLALYAALRQESPAPFDAYLELPDACVVGSSPERFLRATADGHVESRPIKGTRPRGDDADLDAALAEELVTSPKDRAENLMIVDLVRNDLGRVCAPGTVRVPELMQVESYATVFQLVSTVVGRLADDRDGVDLVRACFPPGSMTGAPKIAAMRIAGELEPVRRGIYSGALGYLDVRGGLDLSVVIRTWLVKKGRAYLHVGGAVVADSDPDGEYDESLDKARALWAAIERAGEAGESS